MLARLHRHTALSLPNQGVGADEQTAAGLHGRLHAAPQCVHDRRERLTVKTEGWLARVIDGGQRQRRGHILDQLEVAQIHTGPLELAAQPPPPVVVTDAAGERGARTGPRRHQRDVRDRSAEVRNEHVRLRERRHRPLTDQIHQCLPETQDVA